MQIIRRWTDEDDEEADAVAEPFPPLPPSPSRSQADKPRSPLPPPPKLSVRARVREARARRRSKRREQLARVKAQSGDDGDDVIDVLWLDEVGMWEDEVEKQASLLQRIKALKAMLGPLQVALLKLVTHVEKIEALLCWEDPWVRYSRAHVPCQGTCCANVHAVVVLTACRPRQLLRWA